MKNTVRILFLAGLTAGIAVAAADAQTVALSGDLDQSNPGWYYGVDNDQAVAQQFFTASSFDITQVTLDLEPGNGDGEFQIAIYNSTNDEPDSLVQVLATPDASVLSSSPLVLSGLDVTLPGNSAYFMVVSGITLTNDMFNSNNIVWYVTPSSTGAGVGYSSLMVAGGPGSWSGSGDPARMEIDGQAVPEASPVLLAVLGGAVVLFAYRRRRVWPA